MRRHRTIICAVVAIAFLFAVPSTFAHDFDRHNYHPLRTLAYPFHAVGVYAEYTVIRPIHWLVSQPDYDAIFGHQAYPDDDHWSWGIGW